MSALTWTTLETELLVALAQAPPPYDVAPPDFAALYPRAISYAESRICQEIPLLANRKEDISRTTTTALRTIDLTSMANIPMALEGMNIFEPNARTVAYDKATADFVDHFWPVQSVTMNPFETDNIGRYWAMQDATTVVFGPTTDAAYKVRFIGLFQPTPLSAANPSTYLSTTYPELLVAGCMVFMEATLKRNFGAQAEDPKAAASWEGTYGTLKAACAFEEARRRGIAPDIPHPGGKAA